MRSKKYLVIDFNTTDFLKHKTLNKHTLETFPHVVQAAWILFVDAPNDMRTHQLITGEASVHLPIGVGVSDGALKYHGIDGNFGLPLNVVMEDIAELVNIADVIVAHNLEFDLLVLRAALMRSGLSEKILEGKEFFCTMQKGIDVAKIPSKYNDGEYKYPSLAQLYEAIYGHPIPVPVTSKDCVFITVKCLAKMLELSSATEGADESVKQISN